MGKNIINIALFGLGRIGQLHAKNLKDNQNFNLKYIYDIDKSPLGISSNIWHFHNKINNIDFSKLNKFLLNLEKREFNYG